MDLWRILLCLMLLATQTTHAADAPVWQARWRQRGTNYCLAMMLLWKNTGRINRVTSFMRSPASNAKRSTLTGSYTMAEIGNYFGVHYMTVSRAVHQHELKENKSC